MVVYNVLLFFMYLFLRILRKVNLKPVNLSSFLMRMERLGAFLCSTKPKVCCRFILNFEISLSNFRGYRPHGLISGSTVTISVLTMDFYAKKMNKNYYGHGHWHGNTTCDIKRCTIDSSCFLFKLNIRRCPQNLCVWRGTQFTIHNWASRACSIQTWHISDDSSIGMRKCSSTLSLQ
jgi:hypothetical protein